MGALYSGADSAASRSTSALRGDYVVQSLARFSMVRGEAGEQVDLESGVLAGSVAEKVRDLVWTTLVSGSIRARVSPSFEQGHAL